MHAVEQSTASAGALATSASGLIPTGHQEDGGDAEPHTERHAQRHDDPKSGPGDEAMVRATPVRKNIIHVGHANPASLKTIVKAKSQMIAASDAPTGARSQNF